MDRREELKAKARDHERREQPEHALEVYLSLVADAPPSGQGGLWAHIGDLQERIGAVPSAVESYAHAVAAFSESGQLNNAVAVSQRILRLDPQDATAHLRLGELSLSQGYREFARSGIGNYARLTAATDRPEDALEPLAAFLSRFPDDTALWKELEGELLSLGKQSETTAFLERLREVLTAGGHTDAVERLGRELLRMDATNGAGMAADRAPATEGGEADSAASLPLLDSASTSASEPDTDVLSAGIAPLEGLESTGGDAYAVDESGTPEELPLLGTLPELTTDRGDLEVEQTSAPLAGVERFEFGGDAAEERRKDPYAEPAEASSEGAPGGDDPATPDATADAPATADEDEDFAEDIPLLVPDLPSSPAQTVEPTSEQPGFDPVAIGEELRRLAGIDAEPSDAASHYDLGLAYKEMDRLDESLANLAMAIRGGHDPAAVLEVSAEILVRKGEFALADDLLRRLPGVGDHALPEHVGVHYWLARASEESGRRDDARHALELVVSVDPDFRDASERLRKLV